MPTKKRTSLGQLDMILKKIEFKKFKLNELCMGFAKTNSDPK